MPAMFGLANAFWIAAFVGGKLDDELSWGWGAVLMAAFAPLIFVAFFCWWAAMYDQSQRNPNR